MNRTLSNVLLFTAGVAVGSLVTWKIFKSRYEIVDGECDIEVDEVDDVESDETEDDNYDYEEAEAYEQHLKETENTWAHKPPLKEYVQKVKQLSYADVDTSDTEEDDDVYEPYIISPDEYGEDEEYERLTLNYYADGVLADDLDNVIEDVEGAVPADFADHFGEYEDDCVFVKNDERQCYYEILRNKTRFADIISATAYPSEDE